MDDEEVKEAPRSLPIGTGTTPSAVMEIVLRLKIKDAMTINLRTARRSDSLKIIQNIMKENHISGVPIIENNRLVGMVSVNHIMKALDGGFIDDPADVHMARSLMVLEDDMPLSFAISYFNKYSYHRYPIIDKNQHLVGILTSRDILLALLKELNDEMDKLESIIERRDQPEKSDVTGSCVREFPINKFDFENAGKASFELKKILKERGIKQKDIRRASIASYELEVNLAIHSDGGRITFLVDDSHIVIETRDEGPGIADVELVIQEGYSTANQWIRSLGFGAGMGLANTRKVSDEFDIESELGKGTHVKSIINLEGIDDNT